ncbi:MAG: hypothetical protein JXR37_04420 [Kiritimatiellae bacterium]|nr:hypothetical protein [Kiritimatiellia bacterium]
MKIPLNLGGDQGRADKVAHDRALEQVIDRCNKGDWEAKEVLVSTFMALLRTMATKRAADPRLAVRYIDAGKKGLFRAAQKYKPSIGPEKFQVFAVDFIEREMDSVDKRKGFLGRLFGGR